MEAVSHACDGSEARSTLWVQSRSRTSYTEFLANFLASSRIKMHHPRLRLREQLSPLAGE